MSEEKEFICMMCPHCHEEIIIKIAELNCHIFRHGVYKKNWQQIDPHMKKKECDRLFNKKLIYGCGKPFKIVEEVNEIDADTNGNENNKDKAKENNKEKTTEKIKVKNYNIEICGYI